MPPGCDVTPCVLMGSSCSTKESVLQEFLRLSSLAMSVFMVPRSLGAQSAQQHWDACEDEDAHEYPKGNLK